MPSLPATDGKLTVLTRPEQIAPDLFAISGQIDFLPGVLMPLRMTILRQPGRSLVVYSPFDPNLVDMSALGTVKAVVAPSTMHWTYARAFQAAHPGSTLYASPGLAERFPREHWGVVVTPDTPEDALGPGVKIRVLSAWCVFQELVLFHAASRTLVAGDLAFNLTPAALAAAPLGCRVFVTAGRGGGPLDWSVAVKLLARAGCREGVKQLDAVLRDWDWDRFVPGHGAVVEHGAKEVFRAGVYRYVSDVARGRDWLVFKMVALLGAVAAETVATCMAWQGVWPG